MIVAPEDVSVQGDVPLIVHIPDPIAIVRVAVPESTRTPPAAPLSVTAKLLASNVPRTTDTASVADLEQVNASCNTTTVDGAFTITPAADVIPAEVNS